MWFVVWICSSTLNKSVYFIINYCFMSRLCLNPSEGPLSCRPTWVCCFQVIELDLEQLPEGDEVLTILRQEQAPMNNWVTLAVSDSPSTCVHITVHMFSI